MSAARQLFQKVDYLTFVFSGIYPTPGKAASFCCVVTSMQFTKGLL
jgi:hypothetical protein